MQNQDLALLSTELHSVFASSLTSVLYQADWTHINYKRECILPPIFQHNLIGIASAMHSCGNPYHR
jgi:hypothetical protein